MSVRITEDVWFECHEEIIHCPVLWSYYLADCSASNTRLLSISTNDNNHRYRMQCTIMRHGYLLVSLLYICLKETKSHMRQNISSHLLKAFNRITTCTHSRKLTISSVEQWRQQVLISSLWL
jgi:hypothetical protein